MPYSFSEQSERTSRRSAEDISGLMTAFIDDCDERLRDFIAEEKTKLAKAAHFFLHKAAPTSPGESLARQSLHYSPRHDIDLLFKPLLTLAQKGKRTRARLVFLGFFSITDVIGDEEYQTLVDIACAVEIFQLAALIHDDIIDSSEIRRGSQAAHVTYSNHHTACGWDAGQADTFGQSAAILLGDLALAFANEIYASSVATLTVDTMPAFYRSNRLFLTMHSQVMLGQFLDILAESSPLESSPLPRAHLAIILKSALYSVLYPLQLGALLSGAEKQHLNGLQSYALPLGQAFQLRDDILGIFGDQNTMGKPRGDDIREGKQTVLISYAFELLDDAGRDFLKKTLGDAQASVADIEALTQLIKDCGALTQLENTIDDLYVLATAHMPDFIPDATKKLLEDLSRSMVHRSA